MRISVVRPDELGPAEIASWHAMQRGTPSLGNPFLCPEFAVAVGRFRRGARVAILADGPQISGFFPFERRRLGVAVPIGAGLSDCQGLVHAPGLEWDCRELLRACKVSVWQFDHLADGQRPFDRYTAAVAPSPAIDLSDGFAAYEDRLRARSPQFCKDLARKTRKLGREAGDLRFVLDSANVADLRALMRWKSDQYRRTGRSDRFDRPWIVDLVDHLFSTHSEHFGGLLSVLYAGEAPVAAHFGVRSEHVLAQWFPAYDTQFGRYSPGLIQQLQMARDAAPAGIGLIDMGKGAKHYKETLKSHDLMVAEGIVTRGSLLSAAHRARTAPATWAIRTIRQHQPLFDVTDRMLRRYGQLRKIASPRTARDGQDRGRDGSRAGRTPAGSLGLPPVED